MSGQERARRGPYTQLGVGRLTPNHTAHSFRPHHTSALTDDRAITKRVLESSLPCPVFLLHHDWQLLLSRQICRLQQGCGQSLCLLPDLTPTRDDNNKATPIVSCLADKLEWKAEPHGYPYEPAWAATRPLPTNNGSPPQAVYGGSRPAILPLAP